MGFRKKVGPVLFLVGGIVCLLLSGTASAAAAAGGHPEKPIKLLALIAGGTGIFLVGIRFVNGSLKQMTGGSFKEIIARVSEKGLGVFLWGNLLGFFTQSGKANAFILAGFVQAGLITVSRALPVVFWGNTGASLIVAASVMPIKIVVLFMLGVTGLGLTFGIPHRLVQVYGVLFGLGMIVYGLSMLKTGSAGFLEHQWVHPLLGQLQGSYLAAFLIGTVLTLAIQSDIAVAMLTIAVASSGFFGLREAAMIFLGAQAGAGILSYIFSFHFSGRAREVVVGQIAYNLLTVLVCAALFATEILTGVPLLLAAVEASPFGTAMQVALLVITVCVIGSLLSLAARVPVEGVISRYFPPSVEEILSEPKYLMRYSSASPETGLLLVEKEQLHLMAWLPGYLGEMRKSAGGPGETGPDTYHAAFLQVSKSIGTALSEISGQNLNPRDSDQLIAVTKMQEQLVGLEQSVLRICLDLAKLDRGSKGGKLGANILESLDFLILTAIDALAAGDEEELGSLALLTTDRSEMMDRVRKSYFRLGEELSQEERNFILDITILFESAVQSLSRMGELRR